MPYIVKSSLDIGGKIVPWNEQEIEKLIKEKEKLEEKQVEKEEVTVEEPVKDVKVEENASKEKQMPFKKNKRKDKVGEE